MKSYRVRGRVKLAALAVAALALNGIAAIAFAADLAPNWTAKTAAPDGKIALAEAWSDEAANYITVSVHEGKKLVCQYAILPDQDVRYIRFAWSPDSSELLVEEGQKGGMDLTLVRFVDGKPEVTHFNCDDLIVGPMFNTLPLRNDIRNRSPIAGVSWSSIQWGKGKPRCDMSYFLSGIGHEGEARIYMDWSGPKPKLIVVKISPAKLKDSDFKDIFGDQ